MNQLIVLAWVLACAAVSVGQQAGDLQRDYTISGIGALASSPVATPLFVDVQHMANAYRTTSAVSPVIWAIATQGQIGTVPGLIQNSVDIGPAGLGLLLDGTQPTLLGSLLRTDNLGDFELSLAVDGALVGASLYFAFAHVTPTSADGFFISQTHHVSFEASVPFSCQPGALSLPGSTAVATAVNLGFNFSFYGTVYNQVTVHPVGALSFGVAANPLFAPQAFSSLPEAALAPYATFQALFASTSVSPTFFTDGVSLAEFCWVTVGASGRSEAKVTLDAMIPSITFQYGQLALGGVPGQPPFGLESLVGIKPPGSFNSTIAADLSAGVDPIPPSTVVRELFFIPPPVDLNYRTLIVDLTPAGDPLRVR